MLVMCLIRSMLLEEEFAQIRTMLKMSQKLFTCINAIDVITCKKCYDIGHPHHTLVLLVYWVTSTYTETFQGGIKCMYG